MTLTGDQGSAETVTAGAGERLVVDLLDPELYRRNPHDVWAWMRAHEPVYRDHRNGLWAMTRHAHVMEVERRSSVFVSGQGYRAIWAPEEANMIAQDDPRHRQQRMLVQPKLTRAAVNQRQAEVDQLVAELIDGFVGDGRVELVQQFAGQLPARLTARLLGYPEEMWPRLKTWSEDLMRTDMRDRDGAAFCRFFDANIEFATVLGQIAPEKAACPADDFISIWLHARIDGEPLPPASIVHEVGLFIAGGAETTRTAISHGLRAFADHPDQWEALAADPSLAPGAVEEVLRWVTPLNNFFRRAVADTEVDGHPIGRGDRVILLYPSANRDEAVFDDPFRFDIRRHPNPHLSFGFGTHLCVGANLARLVLESAFTQLPRRVRDLTPLTEPDVEPNIFARAVRRFDLGFTAR
jgi:cytochrome P450 family 142 subfamily A polypeptide 1